MQKFLFDGPNKLFIAKPGVTTIDVEKDLYSDWKLELISGSISQWPEAIRTAGGDPLGGGTYIGGYFFLRNGFKIRPQEANHILTLTNGNLQLDTGETGDIVVPTLGSYNVLVRQVVSNIVNTVSTSGGDPSTIATAVWADPNATSLSSSITFVSGSTTYLSSSISALSSSNDQVYEVVQTMSSSVDFMSSSVIFLSSSMMSVSSSNVQVYDAVIGVSSSVEYLSSSFSYLSSSMIDLSGSNEQVYDATLAMSSSVSDVYTIVLGNEGKLDIAAVSASLAASSSLEVLNQVLRLERAEFGRWKIENNTLTMYDENDQVLRVFALLDQNGQPTSINVFERKPV